MGSNDSIPKLASVSQMSPEELESIREEFNRYDRNHNNNLELSELNQFLTEKMPDLVEFSRVIMAIFGNSKKEKISFDDFRDFYISLQQTAKDETDPNSFPMRIFDKLDKDKNYYISTKEIKHLWKLIAPKNQKRKVKKADIEKIIHDQHPARENWGLSRDEFIKLFNTFIVTPSQQSSEEIIGTSEIYAAGLNKSHQLGVNTKPTMPTTLNMVTGQTMKCIAAGESHTVIIDGNSIVYGLGSNKLFQIGGSEQVYLVPTPLPLYEKDIIWASCAESFTVYLTVDGKILFCGPPCKSIDPDYTKPYIIENETKKHFVYVTCCTKRFCALDELGRVYLFTSDPRQSPTRLELPLPAYDIACGISSISCKFFVIAVTVDGKSYGYAALNNDLHHFALIKALTNIPVTRVYGYANHIAALTKDGKVLIYGNGGSGQCGNGTNHGNDVFKPIKADPELEFVDIGLGENHSIFITKEGLVYSCGDNQHYQLCLGVTKKPILELTPTPLIKGKAVAVACGSSHSLVLINAQKIIHPGMKSFGIK